MPLSLMAMHESFLDASGGSIKKYAFSVAALLGTWCLAGNVVLDAYQTASHNATFFGALWAIIVLDLRCHLEQLGVAFRVEFP